MGVEYSSTIGFGFEISPEGIEYINELDGENGDGVYEYLAANLPPELEVVTAGNYWTGAEPIKYAVSVKRFTHEDDYHDPSGIVPLETPYLTLPEAHALYDIALKQYKSEGQRVSLFTAGLWH